MKQLTILIIGLFFSAYVMAANTFLYITNNTKSDLQVTNYRQKVLIKPYESLKVLTIKRNSGFSPGSVRSYRLHIELPKKSWDYEVIRRGYWMHSRLDTAITTQDGAVIPLFEDSDFGRVDLASDNENSVYARMYLPTGALYDDQHLTISEPNQQFHYDKNDKNVFTLASYNTQLMPFYTGVVNKLNHPGVRARLIPQAMKNYDVVVMQELFDRDLRNKVIARMSTEYKYHTQVVGEGSSRALTGGIVLFSRWPIGNQTTMTYGTCNDSDCMADKGIVYASINKLGKQYHVFGTHLQAWENDNSRASRLKQLNQLKGFIKQQNISPKEPVLLSGDLNIDQHRPEASSLNAILNLLPTPYQGHSCSSDGLTNLMSTDSECMLIDYATPLADYQHPVKSTLRVTVPRALSTEKMWPSFDLSDHYPVEAEYYFSS